MTRIQCILLTGVLGFALFLQLWNFDAPYVLQYETGFQEQIARRHLDPGISVTNGISTINNITESPSYHPTHPPLLQLTLAFLFSLLGDRESTARLIPLFSYLFSMWGLWRITKNNLSNPSRIAMTAAFAFAPLSFYLGRVVNFEPPVVAFIIWTVYWVKGFHEQEKCGLFTLSLLAAAGTLIDWVYLLFFTCLWITYFLHQQSKHSLRIMLTKVWCLSFGLFILYVLLMYGIGAFDNVMHHAKVQSGMYQAAAWKLPLFLQSGWWLSLGTRVFWNATPVLFTGAVIMLGWAVVKWQWRDGLPFWCIVLWMFVLAYILIFSRASNQHFWCLFYFMPCLVLMFGQVLDWIPVRWRVLPVILLLGFSYPAAKDLRTLVPNQTEYQLGRTISSGMNAILGEDHPRMHSPILYTNRVDPLAYYANLDTSYFYISISAAKPDNFLVRFRPEFVSLFDTETKTAVTIREQDRDALYARLQKSYTLVHQEFGTQLWESNWSPHVSLMGLISLPSGEKAKTQLIDDTHDVHVASHIQSGTNAMSMDVEKIWIAGKRWLTGWAMVPAGSNNKPVRVALHSERGVPLGTFDLQPQEPPFRWQSFKVYTGYRPHQIKASWQGGKIIFGDLRLVSESIYTDDITRMLAGEIHRKTRPNHYPDTLRIQDGDEVFFPVSQRPGLVLDRLQVPHIRAGYHQQLTVTYGIHPSYNEDVPITFRLRMRDMALGKPYVKIEETITADLKGGRITQVIDLQEHSRHLLAFTFEVETDTPIDTSKDSALWYNANLQPKN